MKVTPLTFDRTINLPFLITVAAAILAASAWTSTVNNELQRLRERTADLPDVYVRLARIDERGESATATMERIETRLDRIEQAQ